MARRSKRWEGFTIVELLIVVVIIAILAAITIVAYNGIQQRSRDSVRMNDLAAMKKALQLYKVDNDMFPASMPNPGSSTWEISTDSGFLNSVSQYSNGRTFTAPRGSVYKYHTFAAGAQGCPASMGPFYAIWISGMENQSALTRDLNGCTGSILLAPGSAYDKPSNYLYLGF